jgi:hypothetical protein
LQEVRRVDALPIEARRDSPASLLAMEMTMTNDLQKVIVVHQGRVGHRQL